MPIGDGKVFVIERFDRSENDRIHMEDFGQILDRPPGSHQTHGSHEELASIIKWVAPESRLAFLKQVIFNIICGNGDAHLKNFSLIYPDTRNAVLSPAYDLVSTIVYFPEGKEDLSLKLNGSRRFQDICISSLGSLSEALGFEAHAGRTFIQNAAISVFEAWNRPEIQSNFTRKQVEQINSHIQSVPLTGQLKC